LALAAVVLLVALGVQAGSSSLGTAIAAVALLLVVPLTGAACIGVVYRWSFQGGGMTRGVRALVSTTTLAALLSYPPFLAALAPRGTGQPPTLASLVTLLGAASVVGVVSVAVVTCSVLLVELPVRWFLPAQHQPCWDGVLRSLRWIGAAVVVTVVWSALQAWWLGRLPSLIGVLPP
jgi:hypothetical protein